MPLSDRDILSFVSSGKLRIDPFSRDCLTPNGYDLRLGREHIVWREGEQEKIEIGEGESLRIDPGDHVLASTLEYLVLPEDLGGMLFIRSSLARAGIFGSFGFVDAGFEGNLTLSLANLGRRPIELRLGDRFCQIIFLRLSSPAEKPYSGRYRKSKGAVASKGL